MAKQQKKKHLLRNLLRKLPMVRLNPKNLPLRKQPKRLLIATLQKKKLPQRSLPRRQLQRKAKNNLSLFDTLFVPKDIQLLLRKGA